ncbi:MAG: Ldh family oxidoreductase [Spirochaetes bacterium]|nr:Ldh family oxidoreductase [Spirochaetota bacterium]
MSETVRVSSEKLLRFTTEVFERVRVPTAEAILIAESLVEADLTGVDSHGVSRIPIYVKRIETGVVNPASRLQILQEYPGAVIFDGCNSMGIVTGTRVMEYLLQKAETSGAVFATVRNSNHFGIAAFFTRRALAKDMVGFASSNAPSTMAPWGGIRPYLGTNPFSVAVPAGKQLPIVLDMATSVVAQGKIILAAKEGKQIPLGWAISKTGEPTTDPKEALEGTVLPFGGPKGYGIALLIDVLSGVLSGAAFGVHLNNMWNNFSDPQNVGHCFAAVDVKKFLPLEEFKAKIDQMILEIKGNPRAKGVEEIFLPGELEHRNRCRNLIEGIPMSKNVYEDLRQLGKRLGLAFD